MKSENVILERTIVFSLSAIKYSEQLDSLHKYVISKQFLRSATSIGANVRESQDAESKADFIHKLSISLKEANEALYWLELCKRAESYPDPGDLFVSASEIKRILTAIIKSCKFDRRS